jgi:hypothetical protein
MRSRCCLCVCLCISLSLLGNGWVKIHLSLLGNGSAETLSRQRIHAQQQKDFLTLRFQCGPCRIKESRQLVLPRTSCLELMTVFILRITGNINTLYCRKQSLAIYIYKSETGWLTFYLCVCVARRRWAVAMQRGRFLFGQL